ncbi:MAG: matrixin family metalloprotease [Gemmatimonadetes bacterium]|nr:matrixin family metalloprotease [Gemmatimonadota bacterium]
MVFHWPADRLPVRFYAQPIGALPDYVRDGLAGWEAQFLYGEFTGVVSTDSLSADVRVTLDGGVPPAAPLTTAPPIDACDGRTTVNVTETDLLVSPVLVRVRWFPGFPASDVANCLARVTAHELGHALGLLQHSDRPTDLMFGVPAVREPSARDRATVQLLYHTKADIQPASRP